MEFDDDVRLDTSQVRDRRGMRGGGAAIGGGMGVIGVIIALLLGVDPFSGGGGQPGAFETPGTQTELAQECQTGADANERTDCRVVGVVNSVQDFWTDAYRGAGRSYQPAETVFFTDQVSTACGAASSAVGPFYCPTDDTVYIDLAFYRDLQDRFGAQGGPFAQAYVIGHEYGHHVQDLQGTLARSQDGDTGPDSGAVRVELQADCFAGVWAANAVETGYLERLTDADIADGRDAAAAIGDDRIQERAQARVEPENWTHGSSEQRQRWFSAGYRAGDPGACDTFAAPTV